MEHQISLYFHHKLQEQEQDKSQNLISDTTSEL